MLEYSEIKSQAVTEVTELLMCRLKEIEPEVIEFITREVKREYDYKLYEQKLEINYLKERVQLLEEAMAWAVHNSRR